VYIQNAPKHTISTRKFKFLEGAMVPSHTHPYWGGKTPPTFT